MQKETPVLILIIIIYLTLGFLYARLTPPWQTPDEPAHYNHIRYIAEQRSLPELVMGCYDGDYLAQLTGRKFPPELSIEPVCYEHYQPPLYYVLAAPIFRLTGGNLLALRLFSVGLGAISLLIIYRTIRLCLPQPLVALGTTAFVAFVPMHLTMLAAVNNDSLAELLLVGLVFLLLRWLLREDQAQKPLPYAVGLILGLILITKVTAYISLFLVALIIWFKAKSANEWLRNGLRAYLPALLIGLPWYVRNSLVYGGLDVLGLGRHDAVVAGQLRTADYLANIGWMAYLEALVRTTFHSFWGQFGWMAVPMDNRVYYALLLLQAMVGVGLLLWLRQLRQVPSTDSGYRRDSGYRQALWVMAVMILLSAGVFAGLNLSFVQFQGRYFFTALMPLGLFFTLGLSEALRRRSVVGVAIVLLLLVGWVGVSSLGRGGLDKWAMLIGGLAVGGLIGRRWVPIEESGWFVAGIYTGLAGLAAISVWWFIVPNL